MATKVIQKKVKKKIVLETVIPDNTVRLDRAVLARNLGLASKAVSPSPIIPLLGNVLFESREGSSRVAATNYEIGISCTFPTQGRPFQTCIPAKTFASLIDTLNVKDIEMSLNMVEQSVIVNTDLSTSSLKCVSADEFPPIPAVEIPNIILPVDEFKRMVKRVALASSDRDEGSVLEGVLLTVEGDKFIMFAADGFRLSYEETNNTIFIDSDTPLYLAVKGSTLAIVANILPNEGELEIQATDKKVLFHCGDIDIVSQILNGKFPDFKLVANGVRERTTKVVINTADLIRACKQLKVFASDAGVTAMDIQDMLVRYSTVGQEKGASDITLFAEKEGEDLLVSLNVFFLHDFLEVVHTPQVTVEFNGAKKAILLRMEGVNSYYHIIMPLNL